MGPDADQADILLLTFKTKIEEAISLVNQMPENMRQEAWQFWQKVSTAIKTATVEIKMRKPIPGGKEIMATSEDAGNMKSLVAESRLDQDEEEDAVEEFVIESPAEISTSDTMSNVPVVSFAQSSIPAELRMLYSSVYPKSTPDEVEAMITNQESPVVIVQEPEALLEAENQPQAATETINIVVQDYVNDQVITSLVTIDNPNTPLKKSPPKPQPKRKPRRSRSRQKSKKKDTDTSLECDINDQQSEETKTEVTDENEPCPDKTLRRKGVNESDDIVSRALAESTVVLGSEYSESGHNLRRSSRPPKQKVLKDHVEEDGEKEDEDRAPKRRGEPVGPVTCEVCGLELAYSTSLAAHMRKHSGDRPFICSICSKPFTTKANMLRHERTHSGEKPFECEVCSKCFTEKKTLKVHMRSHTGERPFKCEECGMGFTQSGTLKSHMHRHTGHKGNLCDLCGRAFRQKSQLRLHLKRHFNLKPFKCEQCELTFYSKSDLIRHELRHTGERPYACTQCPKTFTRQSYLKEHENHHNGITPYSCDECNIRFSDHSSYYRHSQKHKKKSDDDMHLVVDSEAMDNAAVDSVPALLVTADHIQHLLGVNNTNSGEVYRIALVDQSGAGEGTAALDPSQADFSAINLLASATTQLSMSQDAETDLKQIALPEILN